MLYLVSCVWYRLCYILSEISDVVENSDLVLLNVLKVLISVTETRFFPKVIFFFFWSAFLCFAMKDRGQSVHDGACARDT